MILKGNFLLLFKLISLKTKFIHSMGFMVFKHRIQFHFGHYFSKIFVSTCNNMYPLPYP